MTENYDKFLAIYTRELSKDVLAHPDQFGFEQAQVPAVALKMTTSLAKGTANKDSNAIRRTCRELGVGYTYKEIFRFLNTV